MIKVNTEDDSNDHGYEFTEDQILKYKIFNLTYSIDPISIKESIIF